MERMKEADVLLEKKVCVQLKDPKYIKRERDSNLELLRIVAMLLIIAHHYVVNSGVTANYDYSNITPNMVFLQLWGMWGKTAINVFILISGYFMCVSKLTVKRFSKIYLEAKFYKIVIYLILLVAGYETTGVKKVFKLLFGFIINVNNDFTSSFLMFYLFIPFYNVLIHNINKKQHQVLIGLLIFYFTIAATFLFADGVFLEPVWYMVLYFVAAYIRLYTEKWMKNIKICGCVLLFTVLLAYISVLAVDFVGFKLGFGEVYYMVENSHHFLAFIIGVFLFLLFINLKIKNNRIINKFAATTFGVLCIHASSGAMRTFLWKNLLDVSGHYDLSTQNLVAYSVACLFGVFIICSVIDMMRISLVEKPIFKWLEKYKWFNKELY